MQLVSQLGKSVESCVTETGLVTEKNSIGTNLKVGGPGAHVRRKVPLHCLGSTSTISRFGERFRDGQYSSVSFLCVVLLLAVPPFPAICKSGGTCPLFPIPTCPMESAPLITYA